MFAVKFSQDIYQSVAENDIGVADIAYQNEDVGPINDAVVIWHTIRVLGNVIKQTLTSDVDLGLPIYEQEGVVLQSPDTCNGSSFKLTGEFCPNSCPWYIIGVPVPVKSAAAPNLAFI